MDKFDYLIEGQENIIRASKDPNAYSVVYSRSGRNVYDVAVQHQDGSYIESAYDLDHECIETIKRRVSILVEWV